MYLYCYRKRPNFGDALNDYLWPRFVDVDLEAHPGSEDVFVGIGTILNERLPPARILHIVGSGFGYGWVSTSAMTNWRVHFVRGPRTAKALSLNPETAIADPAILVHRTEDLNRPKDIRCAFMPHHGIHSERLRKLCEEAGVHYLSPEDPCEVVLDEIGRSEKLICSAMHGAIVAEAMRVPWFPVITHHQILLSKWEDWAASMETELELGRLPTIWHEPGTSIKGWAAASVKERWFCRSLEKLSRSRKFRLGPESVLENRLARIEERIEIFNATAGSI